MVASGEAAPRGIFALVVSLARAWGCELSDLDRWKQRWTCSRQDVELWDLFLVSKSCLDLNIAVQLNGAVDVRGNSCWYVCTTWSVGYK